MSASRRPVFDIISHGPEQTRALGSHLGRHLRAGAVVLLSGAIGAGKTTFVQGLARPLQVEGPVQSPTFTLISEHTGRLADGSAIRLVHVDLYRLSDDGWDLSSTGLEEELDAPDTIVCIEWPDRARHQLPEEYLLIEFVPLADEKRNLRFLPQGAAAHASVQRLRAEAVGQRA